MSRGAAGIFLCISDMLLIVGSTAKLQRPYPCRVGLKKRLAFVDRSFRGRRLSAPLLSLPSAVLSAFDPRQNRSRPTERMFTQETVALCPGSVETIRVYCHMPCLRCFS